MSSLSLEIRRDSARPGFLLSLFSNLGLFWEGKALSDLESRSVMKRNLRLREDLFKRSPYLSINIIMK